MLRFRRGLGYKPDERQESEWTYEAGEVGDAPADVDLQPCIANILDQGRAGSCTAHGVAQGMRMSQMYQQAEARQYLMGDGRWDEDTKEEIFGSLRHVPDLANLLKLYYDARSYDGEEDQDNGAQISNVFRGINSQGFFPEKLWPYTDDTSPGSRLYKRPPLEFDREAIDQKPSDFKVEYRRIYQTGEARLEAIRQSHAEGRPVVFGCMVSDDFCRGHIDPYRVGLPTSNAGGHCMVTAGHQADGRIKIVNSWGIGFGIGGMFWMLPEYVEIWRDIWSVACREETPYT